MLGEQEKYWMDAHGPPLLAPPLWQKCRKLLPLWH